MRFFHTLAVITGLLAAGSKLPGQVTSLSATAPTGLDVSLASGASNYTLYRQNPVIWGNLGAGGYVQYSVSASAGTYSVQLYYSNGTSTSGSVAVSAGSSQSTATISPTGAWGAFRLSAGSVVTLPNGTSTLRLAAGSPVQPYNLAGVLLTPVAITPAAGTGTAAATNPLFGMRFYVNPYDLAQKNSWQGCYNGQQISKIANQPQGVWFGDWNTDPQGDVATVLRAAASAGTVPILTVYDIVNRDCGGYSSGGAANAAAYEQWIQNLTLGIGQSRAVVILEPDSLTQYNTASCLNSTQQSERLSLLRYALSMFQQHAPNAVVYMDAGPPNGIAPNLMAQALNYAGVSEAAGVAINVSNYESTADSVAYGQQLSSLIGGKHFVIDTSRNGVGATPDHQWCNPANRGLGVPSQGIASGLLDGYLWVQNPGTSDGTCNGGPAAGQFSTPIACTLLQNSAF